MGIADVCREAGMVALRRNLEDSAVMWCDVIAAHTSVKRTMK